MAQPQIKKQCLAEGEDNTVFAKASTPGMKDVPRRATAKKKHLQVVADESYDTIAMDDVVDTDEIDTEPPLEVVVKHTGGMPRWLFPLASGALAFLLVLQVIVPWIVWFQNQWHYGDARVSYQTFIVQGKPREFLGIGYKGRIEVIELPDPDDKNSSPKVYLSAMVLNDDSNRAVTLEQQDVNKDGIPDLVVHIERSQNESVLFGLPDGTFQWNPPRRG